MSVPEPSPAWRPVTFALRVLSVGGLVGGWFFVGAWTLLVMVATSRPQHGGDHMGALAGGIYGALFAYIWAGAAPFCALPAAVLLRKRVDFAILAAAVLQAVVVYLGSFLLYVGLVTWSQWQYGP